MLPSFNDILWCPDVDGDVMAQGVGGPLVSHTFGAENLDDLSDLVGPELANLMNPPTATAVKVSDEAVQHTLCLVCLQSALCRGGVL